MDLPTDNNPTVKAKRVLDLQLYPKQCAAWAYLTNPHTTEVVYGGAAGGAKTFLGCVWQIHNRLNYAGTRGLIGRARLKKLRQTTLKTFFEVCQMLGLKAKQDYQYQVTEGLIKFKNGSEILLHDLYAYPSDPDFTSLGSLEITDAFVDEAGELSHKAIQVLGSRIRYRLDVAGLPPKMLITCNPARGWLYQDYYKPFVRQTLRPDAAFVQALLADNQNPDFVRNYEGQLLKLDPITRQRLLAGDWEYANDDLALMHYGDLIEAIRNANSSNQRPVFAITADVARFGQDSTVIGLWQGLHLAQVLTFQKQDTKASADAVRQLMMRYKIAPGQVVIDADGVGGGLADQLPGTRGFVAQHQPLNQNGIPQAYANLKAQCYYLLAQHIADRSITFDPSLQDQHFEGKAITERLFEELLAVRRVQADDEGKLGINKKAQMKALIGRSPDLADMVMMRMLLVLRYTRLIFS